MPLSRFSTSLFPALLFPVLLAGCADSGVGSDPSYGDKDKNKTYQNGSLLSDGGGLNIFGGDTKKPDENTGIGVNGFLWRASLDTVSFMPIASADPFGGVILTDWYSPASTPGERTKLNIFIRGRDLRADGVQVSVFRQVKGPDGNWADAPVAPATAAAIENAILTKARQIKLAQKPPA